MLQRKWCFDSANILFGKVILRAPQMDRILFNYRRVTTKKVPNPNITQVSEGV